MNYSQLITTFKEKYRKEPRIFRSPGRINLIGEHTDYNDGFVLPAAVDKEICFLTAKNDSDTYNVYSFDQKKEVNFKYEDRKEVKEDWAQYIIGVIDQLLKGGHSISGVDILFSGNIPMGAGMSSSAALECATVYAFNELYNLHLDKEQIIRIAQKAENDYVGVNCGIMDQFASVFSKQGQAFRLDCRDLSYEGYSLNLKGYKLILVNSEVKHSLASSEYNVRRAECEEGLAILRKYYPNISALRDVSLEQLTKHKEEMPGKVFQRCKYVVEEIQRVKDACRAMDNGDLQKLGQLIYATHEGLQIEYEVSCKELDFLVDFTRNIDEVLGARMMGGGFGGCTINLVEEKYSATFIEDIKKAYHVKFSITPEVYPVNTASGSSEITKKVLV